MSCSGIFFTIFTVCFYGNMAAENWFLAGCSLVAAFVFFMAAIYNDDQKEKRIERLEKALKERGVDDG